MENRWIQNQIAIYMTNKKLVEFNDKLKPAPIEYYAHNAASIEKSWDPLPVVAPDDDTALFYWEWY